MSSHRDFNDVYGQVEYDYSEQRENESGQNEEEFWVVHTLSNCNDIVQKYGIKFFIDKLPTYTKVALSAHYRNLHTKDKDPF